MKRFFLQTLPWTALLGICCSAAGASESDNYVIGEPNCRVVNANPQDNERVTWNGGCKDGFADGAGFLQWYLGEEKRSSYEGELRHGLPNGHGVYQYSSKARYEGEFKDGLREGKGILISPNGSKLEATFVAGSASGYGEQIFSNGGWYRGQWKNGKYDGKGKIQYADGTVYEGDFKAGLREGRGKLQYAAGGFYEGDFKSGMRDGTGSLTMVNGNRYEGGWLKDGYEGVGTMHYASGASYVGGWKLGKYEGTGKVTEADGRTYEAQYRDGIRVDQPALADNTSYAARVLRASSAVAEYTGPYQDAKRHKAFAQSPFGTWGFALDKPSEDEAKAAALEKCGLAIHDGEPPCFIVDVDGGMAKSSASDEMRLASAYAEKYVETMLATIEADDGTDYYKAVNRLRRLIRPSQFASKDAGRAYEDGAKKVNAGQYQAAIAPLESAASASPGVADTYLALGIAFLNNDRYKEAAAALATAQYLGRSDYKVWSAEARLSVRSGNALRARQALLVWLERAGYKSETLEEYRKAANDEADDALRKAYVDVLPEAEARLDARHAANQDKSVAGAQKQTRPGAAKYSDWKDIRSTCAKPDYPAEARRKGAQGNVLLSLHVGGRGEVTDIVTVLSSDNWELDQATRRTAQSCQFYLSAPEYDPELWLPIQYQWRLDAESK